MSMAGPRSSTILTTFSLCSFWFLFFLLVLWVIQIQCTMQIIINRIALLMVNPAQVRTLKLSVLALITLINISVFCIWIPAQLQISQTYININIVWDRMEKAIIAVVDVGLNFYFIHLVRARLIANGLTKYTRLFHFNLVMIAISLSLDVSYPPSSPAARNDLLTRLPQVILIGVMSLPSSVVYIQFHPLVYLVKLHIEMNIADLIACVVRESNPHSTGSGPSYGNGQSSRQQGSTKMTTLVGTRNHGTRLKDDKNDEALVPLPEQDGRGSHTGPGIRMTVETQVMHSPRPFKEDDDLSESSSTREIYNHFAVV